MSAVCVNAGFNLTHFAGLILTHPAALNQDVVTVSRGAPYTPALTFSRNL